MGKIVDWYKQYRNLSLGTRIIIFMVIGAIAGIVFGEDALVAEPLGNLFIRLLMMAAVPLVFFNLLNGISGLSDIKSLGRITSKIAVFFIGTSIVSFTLAYFIFNALQPGKGFGLEASAPEDIGGIPNIVDMLLEMVPANVFQAFAEPNMVQIVIFAVLLGITVISMPLIFRQPIAKGLDVISRLFRDLIGLILKLSPLGIGALIAATFGQYGAQIFGPLAWFLAGVWGTQIIMMVLFVVVLFLSTGIGPVRFFRETGSIYTTALATCSSWATLAVSLEVAENRLKLPKHIYSFTLPLGIQMNKNGTTIMLMGVLLFTAQAAGVTFDLPTVISIIFIGLILETGSGGIPGGGLVIAMIFVQAFNLPLEIAAIVGGIYRLVDMGNTTTNVMSDVVGTIIVTHSEQKKNQPKS